MTQNLFTALAQARAEFPRIEKNAVNPFFESRFADYNSIRDAVDPILEKYNLLIVQFPDTSVNGDPALTSILVHVESNEHISATAVLSLAKKDPQAQGSAITYMKRYAYNSILGLRNVEEDDDGNVAAQPDNKVTARGKVAEGASSRAGQSQRKELEAAFKQAGMSIAKGTKWYHDNFGKDYKSDPDEHNLATAIAKLGVGT
jgi:hypothetical protein